MTTARRVLLGLGSNLGDRLGYLRLGVDGLGDEVVAVSDLYETDPVGGPEQGRFLNIVVLLRTASSAHDLLATCQALEQAAERVREQRWGPRTLDVDVLWIDGESVDDPDLKVPHPRMYERAFVLLPAADVAPDVAVEALAQVDRTGLDRVGPWPGSTPSPTIPTDQR